MPMSADASHLYEHTFADCCEGLSTLGGGGHRQPLASAKRLLGAALGLSPSSQSWLCMGESASMGL